MGALTLSPVPSSLDKFKEKRARHQAKIASLDELIQRLESNPELLRVMDLINASKDDDY